MSRSLCVGIIGDFNPDSLSHAATNAALGHAAGALSVPLACSWLPTPSLDRACVEAALRPFDALWCAPGSPYACMDGTLRAIRFAREQDWPFIGT